MTKGIGILNTSIATENIGDSIIMDSALHELGDIIDSSRIIHFPTHERLSSISYKIQSNLDFNIACGTNLLHSHMGIIKQWNIKLLDSFYLKPVVLLGVGWRSQAKRKTDLYTKWLLKKVLASNFLHSVRDSYTEHQLNAIGIHNVINTGCPTLWSLDETHCKKIPVSRGKDAVMVLTDYSRNHDLDSQLFTYVSSLYDNIYYWCQGTHDLDYLTQLGLKEKMILIPPNLKAYDSLLSDNSLSLDYIGTRLHGGIRALQKSRRAIIIGVDHRANVMGSDFNLPVINRYETLENIKHMITSDLMINISLPLDKISKWKKQFEKRFNMFSSI